MTQKSHFTSLLLLILICVAPMALLWIFAVIALAISMNSVSLSSDTSSLLPITIVVFLLIAGGLGLAGLIKMLIHIYKNGYRPANANTIRLLYAGIVSLAILNMIVIYEEGLTAKLIIFFSPILAALVLIKLTHSKLKLGSEHN